MRNNKMLGLEITEGEIVKPKIFIGSSVEGLSVAYAIQQNLTHDAEPTVWDQGIFDLSKTTMESLTKAVDESDVGVFVFSPDDVTKMRGSDHNTVRDNVIFEFGLFTGKLGRDRVFFVRPDGHDLHLPTDLLGITPGVYNPNREDGRLQAATGPACNQIREAIKKLPIISSTNTKIDSDESEGKSTETDSEWLSDLFNDDYSEARKKLKTVMENKDGEDLLVDNAWMAYIDFKENEVLGLDKLLKLANDNMGSKPIVSIVSRMFSWEKYYDQALDIVDRALEKYEGDTELLVLKSSYLTGIDEKDDAIVLLSNTHISTNPDVAVALSEIYEEDDDIDKAIEVIHSAHLKYPNNKNLAYKYARLLQEKGCDKEALYLLNFLCNENPKNVTYLGYLSNTCLKLNLYDKAMLTLKKANELAKESEAWLLHNIGNLLNNKGFYSESEKWLRKGLEIEPSSEYAHDRLSKAIKSQNEEKDKFSTLCKEGRNLIRNRNKDDDKPNNQSQSDE
ncbi:nucleotide-binding protein [Vibrio fluvialis]|nr:nucleotide-binding protein [Vibrio fluvialis]